MTIARQDAARLAAAAVCSGKRTGEIIIDLTDAGLERAAAQQLVEELIQLRRRDGRSSLSGDDLLRAWLNQVTGTCDVCHETTPFADHLAGTTAQCERCGRGRVRVAAATGITASVPPAAKKGATSPPDTAVTDWRPSPLSAPLGFHRPAPGTCPRCGSASFKRVKAKSETVLENDRVCKGCGSPYTTIPAPMSITVRTGMYVSGVLLILGGIGPLLVRLADVPAPGGIGAPSFPLYLVFISIAAGWTVLNLPYQTHALREKRLKKHQASALPDTPPPVELPRTPDMVLLSELFGILALFSPLYSSLLVLVALGPAAVVCGLIALCQGHVKGLIGLLLGVVGLIVWGAAFLYIISSILRHA
jgi:hypothetical protein